MNSKEHILHIAKLKNNCPKCYGNNGLEISFVQEETETKFFTKVLKQVNDTLYCHNCKTIIYPESWTEDIESVYRYHKKQAFPLDSSLKPKPITYKLLFLAIGIIAVLFFFLGRY
jgi:uncharacterized protein with PIN domain